MSGVNLDALSDAQWDEWIAGCRTLRAMREPYLNSASQPTAQELAGAGMDNGDVAGHDWSAGVPQQAPATVTVTATNTVR
jgi:hypothetical protein